MQRLLPRAWARAMHASVRPRERAAAASAARARSSELTRSLQDASSPEQVVALHALHGREFDDLNLIAAWYQVHRTTASWSDERKQRLFGIASAPVAAAATTGALRAAPLGAAPDGLATQLAADVERRLPFFKPRAISHASYVAAKLGADPLLEAAILPMTRMVERCTPRLLANALWAFAARRVEAPELFGRAREVLVETRVLRQFNAHDLACTAWAFAKAGVHDRELFEKLSGRALASLESFSPNETALLAGALVLAGVEARELFGAIVTRAELQFAELDPQRLAALAWAFARTGTVAPGFFDRIVRMPTHRLAELNDRGLCQLIWALNAARYLHRPPKQQPPVADQLLAELGHGRGGGGGLGLGGGGGGGRAHASTAAGGYSGGGSADASSAASSTLLCSERDVALGRLLRVAQRRLPSLARDEVVFVAWAFAPSGLSGVPALLTAVRRELDGELDAISPQGLSMLGWAHAVAYVPAAPLLERLVVAAAARLELMRPQGVVTLLWASLMLGADAAPLLARVTTMGARQLDGYLPPTLSMLGWVLAANRLHPPPLMRALVGRLNDLPASALSHHMRMQLSQLQAALALEAPELGLLLRAELLLQPGSRPCHDAVASSASHAIVSRALDALGVAHANELWLPGITSPVDIALHGSRHVLQVNGPLHYLPSSRAPGPKMEMQRRHVERTGWRVINVAFWELDAVATADDVAGRASAQLQAFLRARLEESGVVLPPAAAATEGLAARDAAAAAGGGARTDDGNVGERHVSPRAYGRVRGAGRDR